MNFDDMTEEEKKEQQEEVKEDEEVSDSPSEEEVQQGEEEEVIERNFSDDFLADAVSGNAKESVAAVSGLDGATEADKAKLIELETEGKNRKVVLGEIEKLA